MKRLEDLQAYVTGELADGAAADAFEEAMFEAPGDADVVFLDQVTRHGKHLVDHGTWDIGVTKAHLDRLIADGHRVQVSYAGPPGGSKAFEIDRTCELVATVLPLGRTDVPVVDVEIFLVDYGVSKTIKDVAVDLGDGNVYGLCERPLAEMAFGTKSKVTVRSASGMRDVLGVWDLVGQVAAR